MGGRTAGKIGVDSGIVDRYSMQMGGGQRDGRIGGGVLRKKAKCGKCKPGGRL